MASLEPVSGTRRIAFATSDARAFADLRGALLVEAVRRRHAVTCLAPVFEPAVRATLERFGVECRAIVIEAQGYSPFAGYRLKRELADALRMLQPSTLALADLAILPRVALAARHARVPHVVAMLEDCPAPADKPLHKALESVTGLIVATADAARRASVSDWLSETTSIDVVPSAGVDLAAISSMPLPPLNEGLTFLLVTPANDRKAHETFAAAADDVRRLFPSARFPAAKDTTAAAVAPAHVVVHAGTVDGLVPGLLAGLAAARPLITTDLAGARDTVDDRVNGCRVPPADARALAEAMLSFLRHPDQLPAMARASRSKAERRFDARTINAATLLALGLGESFAAAA